MNTVLANQRYQATVLQKTLISLHIPLIALYIVAFTKAVSRPSRVKVKTRAAARI